MTRELQEGNPVNLFGLVKIVPRYHTKGERMVNKEFGNPDSPKVKKVYTFDVPKSFGSAPLPVAKKRLAVNLLPPLQAGNGWVQDKVEGLTIGGDGQVYAVTDNDGVEDATGETVFLRLGAARKVF